MNLPYVRQACTCAQRCLAVWDRKRFSDACIQPVSILSCSILNRCGGAEGTLHSYTTENGADCTCSAPVPDPSRCGKSSCCIARCTLGQGNVLIHTSAPKSHASGLSLGHEENMQALVVLP